MARGIKQAACTLVAISVCWVAHAQNCPATWDGAVGQTGNADGIRCLIVWDDGQGPALIAGGQFRISADHLRDNIARWDGHTWSDVGGGIDGVVDALCPYDDGTGPALFATGFFLHAGGVPVAFIAKWDGATWSPLGSGLGGDAFPMGNALAVYDAGTGPSLYVGGNFTTAGGVPAPYIARWDGQAWHSVGLGLSEACYSLGTFDDGTGSKLYVGGTFTRAGTLRTNRIVSWDGTSWAAVGGGLSTGGGGDNVFSMRVFNDGAGDALYVGGRFTMAGTLPVNHIARWDGTSWSSIGANLTSDENDAVGALGVFDDGRGDALYLGGAFRLIGGVDAARIVRWDGQTWEALGSGVCCYSVSALQAFEGDPHGPSLYVGGGNLSVAGGYAINDIARWGCPELLGDLNCDGSVNQMDVQPFILALSDADAYRAAYPECFQSLADANHDGSVNQFDIQGFVDIVSQP